MPTGNDGKDGVNDIELENPVEKYKLPPTIKDAIDALDHYGAQLLFTYLAKKDGNVARVIAQKELNFKALDLDEAMDKLEEAGLSTGEICLAVEYIALSERGKSLFEVLIK